MHRLDEFSSHLLQDKKNNNETPKWPRQRRLQLFKIRWREQREREGRGVRILPSVVSGCCDGKDRVVVAPDHNLPRRHVACLQFLLNFFCQNRITIWNGWSLGYSDGIHHAAKSCQIIFFLNSYEISIKFWVFEHLYSNFANEMFLGHIITFLKL